MIPMRLLEQPEQLLKNKRSQTPWLNSGLRSWILVALSMLESYETIRNGELRSVSWDRLLC